MAETPPSTPPTGGVSKSKNAAYSKDPKLVASIFHTPESSESIAIDYSTLAKTRLATRPDSPEPSPHIVMEKDLSRRKRSKKEKMKKKRSTQSKITSLHVVFYLMLEANEFKLFKYLSPNQFKYMTMFLGSDMITWVEENLEQYSKENAIQLGQLLMDNDFIRAISDVEVKESSTEIVTFLPKNMYCIEIDPRKSLAIKEIAQQNDKNPQLFREACKKVRKQVTKQKSSRLSSEALFISSSPGLTRLQFIPKAARTSAEDIASMSRRKSVFTPKSNSASDCLFQSNSSEGLKGAHHVAEMDLSPPDHDRTEPATSTTTKRKDYFVRNRSNSLSQVAESVQPRHDPSKLGLNLAQFAGKHTTRSANSSPRRKSSPTTPTSNEETNKSRKPHEKENPGKKRWYRRFLGPSTGARRHGSGASSTSHSTARPVATSTFIARGMTAPNQGGGDRPEDLMQPIRPKLTRIVYRHGQAGLALVPHLPPTLAKKYFFLDVADIDAAFLAQHHSKRDEPKILEALPKVPFAPLLNHHAYVALGGPGPLSGHMTYRDILSCRSVSTYPQDPKAPEKRQGDPICDCYMARLYENRALLVLSDGCSWGPRPRKAAFDAAEGFLQLAHKELYKIHRAQDVERVLISAMGKAHRSILRNKDTVWDAGTTTIVGGMLAELDDQDDVPEEDREWAFFCVNVGDCKVYYYNSETLRFEDVTAGNRVAVTDPCDPGGRLGPYLGREGHPDLRNFMYYYQPCKVGDLLVLVSDGVHDNLDPQILGLSPQQVGLPDEDWDIDDVSTITEAAKNRYRLRCLRAILGMYGEEFDHTDDSVEEAEWNDLVTHLQGRASKLLSPAKADGKHVFVVMASKPRLTDDEKDILEQFAYEAVDLLSHLSELDRRYAEKAALSPEDAQELERLLFEGDDGLCPLQHAMSDDAAVRSSVAQTACEFLEQLVSSVTGLIGPVNHTHAPFTLPVFCSRSAVESDQSEPRTPRDESSATEDLSSSSVENACPSATSVSAASVTSSPSPLAAAAAVTTTAGSDSVSASMSQPRTLGIPDGDFVRLDKASSEQSSTRPRALSDVCIQRRKQGSRIGPRKKGTLAEPKKPSDKLTPPHSGTHRKTSLLPEEVSEKLCDHCVEVTAKSRWAMEQKDGRLLKDYTIYPGKMDHTTCLVMRVGRTKLPK